MISGRATWALVALALSFSPSAQAQTGWYLPEQAARGELLYQAHCASCHGQRLEGNPGAPLAGPAFLARWADGSHSVDDLFYILRTLMPYSAPGSLERGQYADITAHILRVNGYPSGVKELPSTGKSLRQIILAPPP